MKLSKITLTGVSIFVVAACTNVPVVDTGSGPGGGGLDYECLQWAISPDGKDLNGNSLPVETTCWNKNADGTYSPRNCNLNAKDNYVWVEAKTGAPVKRAWVHMSVSDPHVSEIIQYPGGVLTGYKYAPLLTSSNPMPSFGRYVSGSCALENEVQTTCPSPMRLPVGNREFTCVSEAINNPVGPG